MTPRNEKYCLGFVAAIFVYFLFDYTLYGSIPEPLTTQQLLQIQGVDSLYHKDMAGDDEWKRNLYDRLDRIRLKCGDLCSMNNQSTIKKFQKSPDDYHIVVPNVKCHDILSMDEIDAGDLTFPEYPPDEILPLYTLNELIPVHRDRVDKQAYTGAVEPLVWKKSDIEAQIQEANQGTLKGTYGEPITNYVRDQLKLHHDKLINSNVLVIGSEFPWVEAILLSLGVSHVTTLEYREIRSEHEKISTETPLSMREKFLHGKLPHFDGVVSYSSLEHSGLGRYGDALNPWGDILAVARAWCLTKTNGFLFLGVPTNHDQDHIVWNLHRVYSKVRWPLLTANWIYTRNDETPWTGSWVGDKGNFFLKRVLL